MEVVPITINLAPNIVEIVNAFPQSIRGVILNRSMASALRTMRNETRRLIRNEALGSGLTETGGARTKGAEHLWKTVIVITRKSKTGGFAAMGYETFGGGRAKAPHAHLLELGVVQHTTPTGQYPQNISAGMVSAAIKAKGGPDLFAPIWGRFNVEGRRQLDHPGFKGYHFIPRAFASQHKTAMSQFNNKIRSEITKGLKRIVLKGFRKQLRSQGIGGKISFKGSGKASVSNLGGP